MSLRAFSLSTVASFALLAGLRGQQAPADAEELPPATERRAGGDEHKRYFLIGPRGDAAAKAPAKGHPLLLVLPGGDGGEGFATFVRRIAANAAADELIVASLVAPVWYPGQGDKIVWPTAKSRVDKMQFTTEQFVAAVLRDVAAVHAIDPARVFTLSWSSGGPAAYAASLDPSVGVTGSFVAMSVWKPRELPPLAAAKGHGYFLLHSPTDFIPIAMARQAREALDKAGAEVEMAEYEGGHGWHGDVYGNLRRGLAWLDEHHGKPDAKVAAELKKLRAAAPKAGAGGEDDKGKDAGPGK